MRILMLGWEFPPFISGGLGTACYGLTRALDGRGHRVRFVLPRPIDGSSATHVDLISPDAADEGYIGEAVPKKATLPNPTNGAVSGGGSVEQVPQTYRMEGFSNTEFVGIPSVIRSSYGEEFGSESFEHRTADGERVVIDAEGRVVAHDREESVGVPSTSGEELLSEMGVPVPSAVSGSSDGADYSGDVLAESGRYAGLVLKTCAGLGFDVIHAHDWMTYPAGLAIARITGKPLVVHVHSTEFDRSGQNVHQRVYDIERRGMHGAVRVIAVSQLTASVCEHRYGVRPECLRVVYNGVEQDDAMDQLPDSVASKDKIVLFLGRITMQKGPEYFVRAAKRVLEKMDNVKFLVAGNGDLARQMIEHAAELGIGHKVLFTGFLRGKDVTRVFKMADCYVMPSVSEPFGIAPLEAMSHDVPVIISKQSGVSEVLTHALKVDFWDTDEMANKIIAVLRHHPLSQTLREHSRLDLHRLTWDGAAEKCLRVYQEAIEAVSGSPLTVPMS